MQDEKLFTEKGEAANEPLPIRQRMLRWVQQGWRPAGTVVTVLLALAFAWTVVNGKHGLSAWYQQRAADKQLQHEIRELQKENGHLRDHVDRLKSDPGAIEHEAREKLHYAKAGEVIYTLPAQPQTQGQPSGNGK
jgi:cell division protein FtsB